MAIQQTKRQTDLEKRLQLLRRQIYGGNKNQSSAISYQLSDKKQEKSDDRRLTRFAAPSVDSGARRATDSYPATSDLTYLHQDLLKIAIFSSLAIGAQILLYFASRNQLINLFK